MSLIPVEVVRKPIDDRGVRYYDIAMRLGWYINGCPDTSRVKRRLGLLNHVDGYRHKKGLPAQPQKFIQDETAAKILDAAGVPLAEAGL